MGCIGNQYISIPSKVGLDDDVVGEVRCVKQNAYYL